MIRRITALVTAVMMALLLSVTVFAADNPGGDHGLLIDERDIFTSDEEDKINDLLLTTARTIHMNVAVLMPELITSTEQEACDNVISTYFDRDSSSIVLMLPREGSGYDDWISYTNRAADVFHSQLDSLWDAVYYGLDSGESVNYTAAIVQFCAYLTKNQNGYVGDVDADESVTYKVRLSDQQGELDGVFDSIKQTMQETADEIGANIGVVLTNGVGPGNEQRYTDNFLNESFGEDSSSIVLMLVKAGTGEQDWISCSQHANDIYGNRVSSIFDEVYRGLDSGSGDNYPLAIEYFCSYLRNNRTPYAGGDYNIDYDYDGYYDDYDDGNRIYFSATHVIALIIAAVIAAVTVNCISAGYRKKTPISARAYVENNMTKFTGRSDVFVREFTTSQRISSSSSGGGGGHRSSGGGGGHSRSGGHGGGGGRRR